MKVKWTPGPWRVEVGDNGNSLNSLDIVADEEQVAFLCKESGKRRTTKRMKANARLIAAAPVMYKALKEICDEALADGHDIPEAEAMEKGLTAIRYAEHG